MPSTKYTKKEVVYVDPLHTAKTLVLVYLSFSVSVVLLALFVAFIRDGELPGFTVISALILNALGSRRLQVNVSKCPKLTEALEKQQYDDKGKPDKTKGFDHFEESLGYVLHYLHSIEVSTTYTPIGKRGLDHAIATNR